MLCDAELDIFSIMNDSNRQYKLSSEEFGAVLTFEIADQPSLDIFFSRSSLTRNYLIHQVNSMATIFFYETYSKVQKRAQKRIFVFVSIKGTGMYSI